MNISLMLNRMIKGPSETLKFWKEAKQDPNDIGQVLHDEALAENPHIVKPGSEEILHTDSITRLMRGNVNPDAALKEKLNLEKNAMLDPVLKESEMIENGIVAGATTGVSTGTPIAPISPPSKSKIAIKIENAYKLRKKKKK